MTAWAPVSIFRHVAGGVFLDQGRGEYSGTSRAFVKGSVAPILKSLQITRYHLGNHGWSSVAVAVNDYAGRVTLEDQARSERLREKIPESCIFDAAR